jgi:predicted dehydrogenase
MDGNSPTSSVFPNAEPGTYTIFYTRFAEALSGQGEVPVKAEDARDVLGLVELALESSRTGRTLDV